MKPASQRSRHLAPGDKLGKFELIRQVAIGGMAELYLARTLGIEGFEKLVVVKRILPMHAANAAFVDMFLNEARLAATLHHPNVAQVYDIGMEEGEYFFAMEYVHGEDLDQITQQANEQGVPLSMDASLTLVAGLCAGLHYAHEKVGADGKPLEIVHRDVSPSNVIISYDGAVKLVDFGIARATRQQTTTHGGLKGKIAYMSPEQCRSSGRIDRRCDLFSVGMILYELTTGQLPFTGETEYQLLDQIVNRDAPPPSSIVPGYPVALERIVLRALSRDRVRRYTTALELQGALEDFAHENRLRVSPLVLARLMSSLFPARLEEWAHAKAQGAFFVEQHVVRTLIEDGRTPPPDDPALRAAHDAIKAHEAILAEDEKTSLDGVPGADDTDVGAPPITSPLPTIAQAAQRKPTPNPTRSPTPNPTRSPTPNPTRSPTPNPTRKPTPNPVQPQETRMPTPPQRPLPGMVPIIGAPGTLVSSSMSNQPPGQPAPLPATPPPSHAAPTLMMQVPQAQAPYGNPPVAPHAPMPMHAGSPMAMPHAQTPPTPMPLPPAPTPPMPVPVAVQQVGDVTERVHVPRGELTLRISVPKRRSPLIWIAGLVVVAGSIAAVIALKGNGTTASSSAAVAPPPAAEPSKAESPPVEAAKPEPPPVEAAKPESPPVEAAKPEAPAVEAAKPEAPPVEAAKPEAPPVEAAKPEPPKAEPPPVEATPEEPKKVTKVATKPKVVKHAVEKKPVAQKPEPKESPSWNADSPFMPVRTGKH